MIFDQQVERLVDITGDGYPLPSASVGFAQPAHDGFARQPVMRRLGRKVEAAIDRHEQGLALVLDAAPQFDDMAILVVQYRG